MKNLFSALVIGSGLLFTTLSHAAVIQDVCDTCITESHYKKRVINLLNSSEIGTTTESVYIFNFQAGVLKKYNVSSEVISGPDDRAIPLSLAGGKTNFIIPISVSSLQQSRFDRSVELYSAAKSSVQESEIPSSVVDSAYSLVGAGYKENDLADFYNANERVQDKFTELYSAVASVTGKLPNVQMNIQVKFSDGTTAILLFTRTDFDGRLRLKFVEGKDVDHNAITNEPKSYTLGSYRFTKQGQDGVRKLMEAAGRLGSPIYNGGSSDAIGGRLAMTCGHVRGDYICSINLNHH